MHRFKGAAKVFSTARMFGRGLVFSAWLAVRYIATGSTGKYRISCLKG